MSDIRIIFAAISLILLFIVGSAAASSPRIVAISASVDHCLALGDDGSVWEWGGNSRGGLNGIPDNPNNVILHEVTVRIPLTNVTAISAGSLLNAALTDDGSVWIWGRDPNDYLGGDRSIFRIFQLPIANVTSISAGKEWLIMVKNDGTVWAWGDSTEGYLGNGEYSPLLTRGTFETTPVQVEISNVTYADGYGCFAVKKDGTVWAWGSNVFEQIGNDLFIYGKLGDFDSQRIIALPAKINTLTDIIAVSSGEYHTLALKKDGSLWAWGTDYNGQLGDGGKTGLIDPITDSMQMQNSTIKSKIDNVTAISAFQDQSMALKDDGTVWTWGTTPDSNFGSSTPSRVEGLSNIISVSCGYCFYMALKSDGSVWVWGDNQYGQAGDKIQTYHYSPVQIKMDYSNAMMDAVLVPCNLSGRENSSINIEPSAVPSPAANNNSLTNSATPTAMETTDSSVPGSMPQGNGVALEIAGVVIFIMLILAGFLLFRRK